MEGLKSKPAEQHRTEMLSNQEAWQHRRLLRVLYARFYELIRKNLAPVPGAIAELGSGIGSIKEFIPECVTTDIFPNPWLDRRENAYTLNFRDASVSSLILLDVFHHLEYPGTALNEFRRVLRNKGRVIILDPAMGVLGRLVYGLFHHEPLGLREPITWFAPDGFDPENACYFAAQANASRVFLGNEFTEELSSWTLLRCEQLPEIAYVASGGFSKPQLYPLIALPILRGLEKLLATWPSLFATRLLVVIAKQSPERRP
ncbi:MAG: class I SAM-dependent methyltransferase [Verrucomicrobia bacterium]|nr:class I SAM-dependent methyltransferase [Verrucomicrobiota bacterium]